MGTASFPSTLKVALADTDMGITGGAVEHVECLGDQTDPEAADKSSASTRSRARSSTSARTARAAWNAQAYPINDGRNGFKVAVNALAPAESSSRPSGPSGRDGQPVTSKGVIACPASGSISASRGAIVAATAAFAVSPPAQRPVPVCRHAHQDGGSTGMQLARDGVANSWNARHRDVKVTVAGGGSGAGITAANTGTFDIGNSSRDQRSSDPPLLVFTKFAREPFVIIVNPANPIANLTLAQIKAILTGPIRTGSRSGRSGGRRRQPSSPVRSRSSGASRPRARSPVQDLLHGRRGVPLRRSGARVERARPHRGGEHKPAASPASRSRT